MDTRIRWRLRAEITTSAVATVMLVATIVNREWIELLIGTEPDAGSGALEWLLALGPLVISVVSGALARCDHRRLQVIGA